jgi:hypothetical protein
VTVGDAQAWLASSASRIVGDESPAPETLHVGPGAGDTNEARDGAAVGPTSRPVQDRATPPAGGGGGGGGIGHARTGTPRRRCFCVVLFYVYHTT